MPLVSIRLPDDVESRLNAEAERTQRPKSEIARDAIIDYLRRVERGRFLAEIARAARDRGDDEALETATEALRFDNESLAIAEGSAVRQPSAKYRTRKGTGRKTRR